MVLLRRIAWWLLILLTALHPQPVNAATWVTEEKVSVDRCASAWFIKRFVDTDAQFVFFKRGSKPPAGTTYAFLGAEYFNRGGDCTFTALVKRHQKQPGPALRKINEFANDAVNWRYGPQFFGNRLLAHIGDLRAAFDSDATVYRRVFLTFDLLFLVHGGDRNEFLPGERAYLDAIEMRLLAQLPGESVIARLNEAIAAGQVAKWQGTDESLLGWMGAQVGGQATDDGAVFSSAADALGGKSKEIFPEALKFLKKTLAEGLQQPEVGSLIGWLVQQDSFADQGAKKMVEFQAKILEPHR